MAFLFELEFFFYFEIEKTVVIVHVFLFRNGKKNSSSNGKTTFSSPDLPASCPNM